MTKVVINLCGVKSKGGVTVVNNYLKQNNTKNLYVIYDNLEFKKYIDNYDDISFLKSNYNVAIITPDKDIIPGADTLNPAYIVFDNYEIILQWNRSLRFALAVCTLKDKFKNEL